MCWFCTETEAADLRFAQISLGCLYRVNGSCSDCGLNEQSDYFEVRNAQCGNVAGEDCVYAAPS